MNDRHRMEALVLVALLATLGCNDKYDFDWDDPEPAPPANADAVAATETRAELAEPATQATTPKASDGVVFIGAGDIADSSRASRKTAALLEKFPDALIFTLGDNAYRKGTAREFQDLFDPTWGKFKARIRPAPGNHDYGTTGAKGYFDYFGEAAGDRTKGYYSYDYGAWHIIVINTNGEEACDTISCAEGSAQEQWLRADLAAHPNKCTLAYWHHPLFSSGKHGGDRATKPIWKALHEAGADVVLTGHDHLYERFGPQDANGAKDEARGIRSFVVGTGGRGFYDIDSPQPNSEVRNNDTFGVLKLTLHPDRYDWEFIPEEGKTFRDSGSDVCH